MLKINILPIEVWNSSTQSFETLPGGVFAFENSLRAIAKWESKYRVSFFRQDRQKTQQEIIYYFQCMCMTNGFKTEYLTPDVIKILSDYMSISHTATVIKSTGNKSSRELLTSELLYAYMVLSNVPFECDKWEINRLLMLLECIGIKSDPKGKSGRRMSEKATFAEYSKLNRARRAALGTKG